MSVLTRISMLIAADVGAMSRSGANAEKMVEEYILQMRAELTEARAAAAVAMSEETRLRSRHEHYKSEASNWHGRAEVALRNGEDGLAREALLHRIEADRMAGNYEAEWSAQHDLVHDLRDALARLEARISEAEAIKELAIARNRRAQAGGSAEVRATPEASTQSAEAGREQAVAGEPVDAVGGRALADRIAEIEDRERVEQELARMKRDLEQRERA